MKKIKFKIDLSDFLFGEDSNLQEDLNDFISEEISEYLDKKGFSEEDVSDINFSVSCKVNAVVDIYEKSCEDCIKLGETICGNDTTNFSCYQ